MSRKKAKEAPTTTKAKAPAGRRRDRFSDMSPERQKLVNELAEKLRREVRERLGPNATFEQESDAAFEIMQDVVWKSEDDRLRGLVTDADEVNVDGKKFGRMEQGSSAAHSGHRDHRDRFIVITPIGHRDRSEATLA